MNQRLRDFFSALALVVLLVLVELFTWWWGLDTHNQEECKNGTVTGALHGTLIPEVCKE